MCGIVGYLGKKQAAPVSVVDRRNGLFVVAMRVSVIFTRLAVSCPTRVSYAANAAQRLAASRQLFQNF